jgi:phosphatidylserine/phosphatidylglycerophosphate/cardiolipin synthase-like enzyme
MNLNELYIETHDDIYDGNQIDYSYESKKVDVVFKNIKERIINEITFTPCMVGCIAWLTDFDILKAMAERDVQIIVQKEDFLRPDLGSSDQFKNTLKDLYSKINTKIQRHWHTCRAKDLSFCSDPTLEGIRCVGNYNRERKPAMPRMHNKFLVLGDNLNKEGRFEPWGVITGSYNYTNNANNSFENIVVIRDKKIANAYYNEWGQILAFSEKLNWEFDWVQPEYRLGT